jgi:cytidine deaminase
MDSPRLSIVGEMEALARSAAKKAYAPYSGFHVGAVMRGAGGGLYAGCNVENAAFPEGVCAEASAISAMVIAGETKIAEVLVISKSDRITSPCGGCRQRISEFAGPDTQIHCLSGSGARQTTSLGELLPHSFGPEHLK